MPFRHRQVRALRHLELDRFQLTQLLLLKCLGLALQQPIMCKERGNIKLQWGSGYVRSAESAPDDPLESRRENLDNKMSSGALLFDDEDKLWNWLAWSELYKPARAIRQRKV